MKKLIFIRSGNDGHGEPQVDVVDFGNKIGVTMHSSTMGEETRRCEFSAREISDLYSALGQWLSDRNRRAT